MLLRLTWGAATAALLFVPAAQAADKPTLTVSVFGISQDVYKRDLYTPFEAKCGCTVVIEAGNASERLAKLEANKANPVVDVTAIADFVALDAAKKGLLQPIDTANLANWGKLYDIARDPLGDRMAVGYTFYSTSIVYRTDKVKITSWKDLFQPALKGRVALPNIATTQAPILLSMLDKALGGTTPDYGKAIDAIAANKADIVTFYARGAQVPQLMEQEEIFAAVVGRFDWPSIRKVQMPIAWAAPAEGMGGGMNVLAIVKGSKQVDLAHQFIDYWLSEEVQTKISNALVDSPANKDVKLPDDKAQALTYGAETVGSLKLIKPADLLENREKWLAGWNGKVAR
jgi:putative spermidine/putrescine transport system substrate-binding protein